MCRLKEAVNMINCRPHKTTSSPAFGMYILQCTKLRIVSFDYVDDALLNFWEAEGLYSA